MSFSKEKRGEEALLNVNSLLGTAARIVKGISPSTPQN